MNDVLETVRQYLHAIEQSDEQRLLALLDPALIYRELPNRLVPEGSTNDRTTMMGRFAKGKTMLRDQRYEVVNAIVRGEEVVVEVAWTGTLAIPLGKLAAGDTMRVFSAIFVQVRDGKIVAQRNYDCVVPF